jgi:hypothetical protein
MAMQIPTGEKVQKAEYGHVFFSRQIKLNE